MSRKLRPLVMSICGLGISVALLAAGTYAWFSISKSAEVNGVTVSIASTGKEYPFEMSLDYGTKEASGEEENATWGTEIYLSQILESINTLRPVSTYDGEHWFFATYDASGAAFNVQLIADDYLSTYMNANVDNNYIAYVDVWIQTLDADAVEDQGYTIRLSNPTSTDSVQDQEENFGTYVLWEPTWDTDGNLQATNDAMTAFRAGFQVEGEENFYIYEPNADMRSSDLIAYSSDNLETEDENGTVGYLVEMDSDQTTTAGTYETLYEEGVIYATQVPVYDTETEEYTLEAIEDVTDGTTVLIQQTKSEWDTALLESETFVNNTTDLSRAIKTIGTFVDSDGEETLAPTMTYIQYGEVTKMRIYFWIEGQDIDCWNQIAGSSIYASLEFTGDLVEIP